MKKGPVINYLKCDGVVGWLASGPLGDWPIYTVNVDIFVCIDSSVFMKMGNFACIKIHVLSIIDSFGYYKSNFQGVHIFADI